MMLDNENCFCVGGIIDMKNKKDPEAILRILDDLVDAVEEEGASFWGGTHPLGTHLNCDNCKDFEETKHE